MAHLKPSLQMPFYAAGCPGGPQQGLEQNRGRRQSTLRDHSNKAIKRQLFYPIMAQLGVLRTLLHEFLHAARGAGSPQQGLGQDWAGTSGPLEVCATRRSPQPHCRRQQTSPNHSKLRSTTPHMLTYTAMSFK